MDKTEQLQSIFQLEVFSRGCSACITLLTLFVNSNSLSLGMIRRDTCTHDYDQHTVTNPAVQALSAASPRSVTSQPPLLLPLHLQHTFIKSSLRTWTLIMLTHLGTQVLDTMNRIIITVAEIIVKTILNKLSKESSKQNIKHVI